MIYIGDSCNVGVVVGNCQVGTMSSSVGVRNRGDAWVSLDYVLGIWAGGTKGSPK